MKPKTLLAFGFYNPELPHFQTICDAYVADGWTILHANTRARGAFGKLKDLLRLWHKRPAGIDAVLVPFPGHHLVPFVWLLTRFPRKKLFFEAFISLYDTKVIDALPVDEKPATVASKDAVDLKAAQLQREVLVTEFKMAAIDVAIDVPIDPTPLDVKI